MQQHRFGYSLGEVAACAAHFWRISSSHEVYSRCLASCSSIDIICRGEMCYIMLRVGVIGRTISAGISRPGQKHISCEPRNNFGLTETVPCRRDRRAGRSRSQTKKAVPRRRVPEQSSSNNTFKLSPVTCSSDILIESCLPMS